MDNIRNNATLVAKIVNSNELIKDVATNSVPQYIFYTPNFNDNGHATNVTFTSNYLKNTLMPIVQPLLASSKTLLVLTYDESDTKRDVNTTNRIDTALLGPMVLGNGTHKDGNLYDHYSVLATIEDNWNLGKLGRDGEAGATPLDVSLFL